MEDGVEDGDRVEDGGCRMGEGGWGGGRRDRVWGWGGREKGGLEVAWGTEMKRRIRVERGGERRKKGAGKYWSSPLSLSSRDIDPVMDPLILKVQTHKQSRIVELVFL